MRVPPSLLVLRHGGVARTIASAVLSMAASNMQSVALGWLIYDISGRALDLGLLGLVEFIPAAVLALVAGHFADRHDRRRVGALALLSEAGVSFAIALYALSNPTSTTPLFVLGFVFGISRAFAAPATRSLLPTVAPPESLSSAIALNSVGWQSAVIVGPVAAGFIYRVGPEAVFFTSAALFTCAAVTITTIPLLQSAVARHLATDRPTLRDALEGLHLIRRHPILLGAISLDLFAVLFGGAVALLPIYAKDILHVGVDGLGWLRAAGGIGAALTALFLAIRPFQRRVGVVLLATVGVFGLATIVFGLSKSFVISMVALAVLNAADMVSVYIRSTLVPLVTPDRLRGRVTAVENVFIGASNELGAFESGVAAAAFGPITAVLIGGIATMGIVGVWFALFPALRSIDRFTELEPDDGAHEASALGAAAR